MTYIIEWYKILAGYFSFPQDYTVVDLETSGLQPDVAEICVLGYTVVRDGKPTVTKEDYVNWWADSTAEHAAIEKRLLDTEAVMKKDKKTFLHTKEKLQKDGRPPKEVFAEYLQLFEDMEARNEMLVAHNGVCFDLPFLVASFHNVLQVGWEFREDLVFDTGIAAKSSQMSMVPRPLPGETLYKFFKRLGRTPAKGVFWKLDGYCDDTFKLFEKAGVDKTLAHTAGTDSLITSYLYEAQRALALNG